MSASEHLALARIAFALKRENERGAESELERLSEGG
jgi:hypothetical protein